mgnify:CR=1 FL=1
MKPDVRDEQHHRDRRISRLTSAIPRLPHVSPGTGTFFPDGSTSFPESGHSCRVGGQATVSVLAAFAQGAGCPMKNSVNTHILYGATRDYAISAPGPDAGTCVTTCHHRVSGLLRRFYRGISSTKEGQQALRRKRHYPCSLHRPWQSLDHRQQGGIRA